MDARLHPLFCPVQGNGRASAYVYREMTPSPALRPYVACYWISEPAPPVHGRPLDTSSGTSVDRVLPDGCTDIIVKQDLYRDRCAAIYCGIFDHAFTIKYSEQQPVRSFGVRFFPGGACRFMGIPLDGLANQALPLEVLLPDLGSGVRERIMRAASFTEQVREMESYLLARLRKQERDGDILIQNLLHRIFISGGQENVQSMAASEAVSTRQMNRKFGQWIGTSPKKFMEIVRFQSVLREIKAGRITDWRTAALERGFYDQAHLIREFKRFYGDTPVIAAQEYRGMSDLSNS
ncbi:helix-turn-helix domain-containing protein [Paenibacillus lutrae]|uniref:Helix-turn-helix domain-containing protein n=1 Tax=Paenibacillus lutrae TaxID=2078573 RepID=A0A7X3K0Q4_9BACL|nr:helix-turn-helix domain-containing protein [Paenibacillus lutrae]MVP01315.1 helix-turn-helix domain-containing protein [Paenibacillus lutrae]